MWLAVARAMVNALGMVSTLILAWFLTPSDFGLVAIGNTLLFILSSVTELSLAAALVRHPDPQRSHYDAAFTFNATRGLILCVLVAASAYPVAGFFGDPRLVEIVLVLSLSLLLGGLTNPYLVTLKRQLIFRQEFVVAVSQKLAGFIAGVTIAIIYQSYFALVAGTLVSQATNVIVTYLILPFRPRITFRHFREFFSFSGWLTASQVINTLNWRFDDLVIGKMLGTSALGYYGVGGNIASMATREMTAPLMNAIYPGFASMGNDNARLAAAYLRTQAMLAAIALPVGVGVALVADPLVRLTMGEKWLPIVFIVRALAAIYAIETLGSLVHPLSMTLGRTRQTFERDTRLFFFRVPAILIGIVTYGLVGVVAARVLTGLVSATLNMRLVKQLIGAGVFAHIRSNARALIATGVMAGGVTLISRWLGTAPDSVTLTIHIAIEVAAGAAIYGAVTALLWWRSGCVDGPEREFLALVSKFLEKFSRGAKIERAL